MTISFEFNGPGKKSCLIQDKGLRSLILRSRESGPSSRGMYSNYIAFPKEENNKQMEFLYFEILYKSLDNVVDVRRGQKFIFVSKSKLETNPDLTY